MTRLCAWCGRVIGCTEGRPDLVTHGICPRCLEHQQAQIRAIERARGLAEAQEVAR